MQTLGNYETALAASLFAALVTTIGIIAIRHFAPWGRRNSTYFAAFAAGVLIAVSFLHIIPHAFAMDEAAPLYLLGGYFLMHLLSRFLHIYVCDQPSSTVSAIGVIPVIGIGFHSLIDGVIYGITFKVSVFTGALAAVGMILHEFPEGIVTYVLMIRGGFRERWAFFGAFLAAAASTPAGTLLSYPFIRTVEPTDLGPLLALAAGALLYVGATHLLPHVEHEPRRYSLLAMAGGVLVAVAIAVTNG